MPHPVWDETQPLGSADSDTIDEIFRDLKIQIHERMDDIVVDWTADPVVLKSGGGANKLAQPLVIGGHELNTQTGQPFLITDRYKETGDGVSGYSATIVIPLVRKMIITKVEALVQLNGATSLDISLRRTNIADPSIDDIISTVTHTAGGITLVTVFNGIVYFQGYNWFRVKFGTSGVTSGIYRVYAVRVTYDELSE